MTGLRAQSQEGGLDVLVVDDEPELRDVLSRLLLRDGHSVAVAVDGDDAIRSATAGRFDLVLLDVALGAGPDGYAVCRILRENGNLVPIVMLTALESEADAVTGLEAGADDYVRKPFAPDELRSRVRAVLRRGEMPPPAPTVSRAGALEIDRNRRTASLGGEPLDLTFAEFGVLAALVDAAGSVLDREELLRDVWGDSRYRDQRGIDAVVSRLRVKLRDDPDRPSVIVTVRGAGYRIGRAQ